jgi:uncharacterized protein (TIGR01370 family)
MATFSVGQQPDGLSDQERLNDVAVVRSGPALDVVAGQGLSMVPWWGQRLVGLLLLLCALLLAPAATLASPVSWRSMAFFYGADIPWETLGGFDAVVVEPDHVDGAGWAQRLNPQADVVAYIALGEVQPSRSYFKDIPSAWLLGENRGWGSRVVDQAAPDWPAFFVERVVGPLWARGFRSFFLDTLDSYQLVARTPEARTAQEAGMVRAVRLLRQRYPQAQLVFNRGFEILPELHAEVSALVVESMYQGWSAERQAYQGVPEADRRWLLPHLLRARDEWRLPVVVIDYAPPERRDQARELARRIQGDGFIPYVGVPSLDAVGVGPLEVAPREVLALHDQRGGWDAISQHEIHRLGEMPFNYWGLSHSYVALHDGVGMARVAAQPLAGRYAAVLVWAGVADMAGHAALGQVVKAALAQGVPLLFMGELPEAPDWQRWGLGGWVEPDEDPPTPWAWSRPDGSAPFEFEPEVPEQWLGGSQAPEGSTVWLRLNGGEAGTDVVAVTPWGGFALDEVQIRRLPGNMGERWAIDPIAFVAAALRLPPDWPVPELTTAAGRRLALIHHDGDGFANRAELPGAPLASEVMYEQFLQRYRLPTTVSFIEGEVSPQGLFAALAPQLKAVARRMAALPHVQLATHTWGHPFFWGALERGEQADRGYGVALRLPGYSFDVEREIVGSARFIERELAPPGKRVRMLLWSGDTNPLEAPLATAAGAGLLNMNGGNTWPTMQENTLTLVSPHAMRKGSWLQVYAPMQNENVYTNLWTGPYYGFSRLLETIALTESPRRIKAVNLYYHTYLFSKPAGVASAHQLYRWIETEHASGRIGLVHATDYAQRVIDARRSTAARALDGSGWQLRSAGILRQWRQTGLAPEPQVDPALGLVGHLAQAGVRYLHLGASEAWLRPTTGTELVPRLVSANTEVRSLQRLLPGTWRLAYEALMPLQALWWLPPGCRLEVAAPLIAEPLPDGLWRVRDRAQPVNQAYETPRSHAVDLRCTG